MRNVIIGTAGHIDHGKTTLIKALTGRNTDRLKEEQERGISIELGFTFFDLPDGRRAGIIDVPGHERFIKNMLAGVVGIDVVLLVVAADEGVMPQTREHLDILQLVKVKKGIIVLTKADLVDDEWLQMVEEEVREEVRGTFLQGAPVVPVSSTTGAGIDRLVELIQEMTRDLEERNTQTIFRLPVDRVFTIAGFGTVVTGTLISGSITAGERVVIYPREIEGRIRNLQVHGENVDTAYAGQRVAINIAGIKTEDIDRGDVIAPPGSLKATSRLDCKLLLLKNAPRMLANRDRVRLHLGTDEILCRVILLGTEELGPGESDYVQLLLEKETVALRGDPFVIRSYSPMHTIGGGTILESNPPKRKRFRREVIEELKLKEEGSPSQVVEKVLAVNSSSFPGLSDLARLAGSSIDELKPIVEDLIKDGKVLQFQGGERVYIHSQYYSRLKEEALLILEEYHKKYPLRGGMSVEEFRRRLFGSKKGIFLDEVLGRLERDRVIRLNNDLVALYNFKVVFTERQEEIKERLMELLDKGGFSPPGMEEIMQQLQHFSSKDVTEVLEAMVDTCAIKRTKEGILFHGEYYNKAVKAVEEYIKQNGKISVAALRDLLDTSRKYAMALLEEMDREKVTKRIGDYRVLYRKTGG